MSQLGSARPHSSRGGRLALLARRYAVAAPGLVYALTLGLARAANRGLVARLAREFGYTGVSPGRLPRVPIDELTRPSTAIVLPAAACHDGNISELELIVLARLVAERKPRHILEIGTFNGRTTLALAASAPTGSSVVTLDLPPGAGTSLPIEARDENLIAGVASGALIKGSSCESRIRQVHGDSATYDFGDMQFDFAFIDGSHSYEYTLSDSRRVAAMMPQGRGVIAWHDYGADWEGVTRALDELSSEPGFSGLRAVEGTSLAVLEIL